MASSLEHPLSNLSLIPADKVFDSYVIHKRQTVLSAKGPFTILLPESPFTISPDSAATSSSSKTGLAQSSALATTKTMRYPPPSTSTGSIIDPSSKVIIVTANHLEGEIVHVEADGLNPPPSADATNTAAAKPQRLVATGESIFGRVGEAFNIGQGIDELKLGYSIDATFNLEFFKLGAAHLEEKYIVWRFENLILDDSEVEIAVGNINPPYVYIKT